MGKSIGLFGAGRGKKTKNNARLKSMKKIFSNCSKQAKPKVGEKTANKKGSEGQSVRWKAWWRQGNIKCAVSKSMPRTGCTKIAMWLTCKQQRSRKRPEYQEEKTNVKCD